MYLQLACNVAAVGDDGIDRQIQFVGNRLVWSCLFTTQVMISFSRWLSVSCSLSFSSSFSVWRRRLIFVVIISISSQMAMLFVILFQRIIVDDGTYQCDVFDTVSVMVCLERGQVEPTAESRVTITNVGSVQMYKVLQCFR